MTSFVFKIAEYIRELDNQEFNRLLCSIPMLVGLFVGLFVGLPVGIFRNDFSLFFVCLVCTALIQLFLLLFVLSMYYISVNNSGSKAQQNGKEDDDDKYKKPLVNQERRPAQFPNTIEVVTQARSVNQAGPQELTDTITGMYTRAEFQEGAINLKSDVESFGSSAIKKSHAEHRALASK